MPKMGGFIDFYFAGWDKWLFDVAVSVNDWCIEQNSGVFQQEKLAAWLAAYAAIRPFTPEEKLAWPVLLQGAALRFWISRLRSEEGRLGQEGVRECESRWALYP